MRIRNYVSQDAEAIGDLYESAVRGIGSRDYSPKQVEAWAARRLSPERCAELIADGRFRLVAVDGQDKPVAFLDLERDGHIDFLYCAPEVAGTGVVSALYDEMEALCRREGISHLYSEASEAAKRFFLKKGFIVLSRRDFEIDGTPIHNYAVEKYLSSAEKV